MAKKIFKGILKALIFIFVYLLQIYVINNTTFFGVNGNLCLMLVVLITLIDKNYVAYITAGICGVASDIIFSANVCKYLVIYFFVVSVLIGLKKMYKQDSKIAIIIFSVLGTAICEILMLVFNIMSGLGMVNIFTLIFMLIKQCIINVFLTFMLYLALRLCKQEGY